MENKTAGILPPDPERMNEKRALWADGALRAFRNLTGTDFEDAVSDLMADLMHWCDRNGMTFANELRRARYHYEEETSG